MSTRRTYRPHKTTSKRRFGFRFRNRTRSGRKILRKRLLKGRRKV